MMADQHLRIGFKGSAVLVLLMISGCSLVNDVDSLHFPDSQTTDIIEDSTDVTDQLDSTGETDIFDIEADTRDIPGIELPWDTLTDTDDDAATDTDITDIHDAADARDVIDDADTTTGSLGSACQTNDDCPEELFCYYKENKGFCATTCLAACLGDDCCPDGYYCGEPGELPEVQDDELVCFKNEFVPCRPCHTDDECKITGSVCTKMGDRGSFCTLPCGPSDACDTGFKCDKTNEPNLCLPDARLCECPPYAATLGASTACFMNNIHGTCTGESLCAVDGFTDCDAPTATREECDEFDNNCDGFTDEEDALNCITFWTDVDKDHYGTGESRCLCAATDVYRATADGDCNDNDADVNPGKDEICGGADENCDDYTDEEGAYNCVVWYADVDGDSWGDSLNSKCLCTAAEPYDSAVEGDCDDTRDWVNPFQATDPVDALFVDQDCDGVDGQKEIAIFVSTEFGNDANDGTESHPKKTIQAGINAAINQPVFVARGTYDEAVQIRNGIDVYGKYTAVKGVDNLVTFTTRDAAATTTIRNRSLNSFANLDHSVITLYGNNINTDTELADLTVISEWPGTTPEPNPAANTISVYLESNCTGLQLSRVIMISGPGGPGASGLNGNQGNNGLSGKFGSPAIETSNFSASVTGGLGGIGACDSRSGGAGGNSQCSVDGSDGKSGVVIGTGGGFGGYGGPKNPTACQAAAAGEDGQPGSTGGVGSHGTAVPVSPGSVSGNQWIGNNGNKGGSGTSGHGGGGGGGGGSSICDLICTVGGSGGGGGGGGCGGSGGFGGASGGGAFGLWIKDTSPKLDNCEINVLGGGTGGTGGSGGTGGNGGAIGVGGTGSGLNNAVPGGNGGKGGAGGTGGGGSGGAGGASYGIYMVNTGNLPPDTGNTIFDVGNGGNGGTGGASLPGVFAPSGPQGSGANTNY